jgi:hypothetical protein
MRLNTTHESELRRCRQRLVREVDAERWSALAGTSLARSVWRSGEKRRLNMGDQQKGGSQSGQEQGGQQKDQNKQPQGSERSGDKNKQGDGRSQGEQKQGGRGGQKR